MNYARGDKTPVSPTASVDWGYTRICTCGKAHGFVYSLIGRPRDIEIERCGDCGPEPDRKSTRLNSSH